jgi:hypothetical protein
MELHLFDFVSRCHIISEIIVLYGCGTWCLTLVEELAGENCIMRSSIICTLSKYWDDQIKEDELGRHVAHMGEVRNVYKVLVAKPEGKRL